MPKVCMIGDDVTIGARATTGRGLRDKLRSSQPGIVYRGTQGAQPHRHEAYAGHDALQLRATALPNVISLEPEIVVIMTGTVAVPQQEADIELAAHQALALAGEIGWYGARVLLLNVPSKEDIVIPEQPTIERKQPIIDYNARLESLLAELALPNVTFVDVCSSLTYPDDFQTDGTGIYPVESGYIKMHALLDAAWPPRLRRNGRGRGFTGSQRRGRSAWKRRNPGASGIARRPSGGRRA